MHYHFLFALFVAATPLVASTYVPIGLPNGIPYSSDGSIDEIIRAVAGGSQRAAQSTTANAEAHLSAAKIASLSKAHSQLRALNANSTYNNVRNSESIAKLLADSSLASIIRQDQDVHRSLLAPSEPNSHQVIVTRALPPIIVNQPDVPPTQVGSGPSSIVRIAPVIYKLKPSVIFEQEVINKVPTPLNLNPVYVKIFKPGQRLKAPSATVVQKSFQKQQCVATQAPVHVATAPPYGGAAPGYGSADIVYQQE